MRSFLLLLLALVLLLLAGAAGRILHLELLRPDLALILTVFVALRVPGSHGAALVFVVGLLQDSLSGLPLGCSALVGLGVWLALRFGKRFLMSAQLGVQLGLLFGASLIAQLATGVLISISGEGPWAWIAVYGLPLAVLQVAVAVPTWALAHRLMRLPRSPGRA